MKKLMVIALLSVSMLLLGSIRVEPISTVSTCTLQQCNSDCWHQDNKCRNRCRKAYPNRKSDYWDCLGDCKDMVKQCYGRCENDCN